MMKLGLLACSIMKFSKEKEKKGKAFFYVFHCTNILCLLPDSVSLGQVAIGVLFCLLITLQWIEFKWKDNRERRKGRKNKAK